MKHLARTTSLLATLAIVAACGDDDGHDHDEDAGVTDASDGGTDNGGPDEGTPDEGVADGGSPDEGAPDEGGTDEGAPIARAPLTTYPSADYATNAAVELALGAQLIALNAPMREADASTEVTPTAAELLALYDAGDPSLRDATSAYYAPIVEGLLNEFAANAGNVFLPSDPPPASGGVFSRWLFNANGVDLRQSVEKGMFGATFYHSALLVAASDPTPAGVDRILALFGANPTFQHDDGAAENPDRFMAQYATRRDNPADEVPGLYASIRDGFLAARGAAEGGAGCETELAAAVAGIMADWERVNFATVIYYLNDITNKMSSDSATTDDLAAGLHGLGEAVAFVHGFRQLAADGRIITDAQIDSLLALFNAAPGSASTVYRFATDPATELPKLQTAIDEIQAIYGFTEADVTGFFTNY